MAEYCVDLVNGNNVWDGSQWLPEDAATINNLAVFLGHVAYSRTATIGSNFTERFDDWNATSGFFSYIADSNDYFSTSTVDATLDTSTSSGKHAFMVLLKPKNSLITPELVNIITVSTDTRTATCEQPTDLADNHIMLAFVQVKCNATAITLDDPPDGWELVLNRYSGSPTPSRIAVYWKRANSESGDYTFSFSEGASGFGTKITIAAYSGCTEVENTVVGTSDTIYTTTNTLLRAAAATSDVRHGPKADIISIAAGPGDVVKVAKTTEPESIGDCTWTDNSMVVTMSAPRTLTIDNCESGWLVPGGATATTNTNRKEGNVSIRSNLNVVGRNAYKPLASTLDLSGYTKISCWIYAVGARSAGQVKLALCSDAAGETPVHIFDFPALSSTTLHCITFDNLEALSSTINSVAIYSTTAISTTNYICIDHIIACNDLTLQSVIGKNTAEEYQEWYPIRSIEGTSITLDTPSVNAPNGLSYRGTTETITTYIRNSPVISSTTTYQLISGFAGTSDNLVYIKGGFNTLTDEQDGFTEVFNTGYNGSCFIFQTNSSFIEMSNFIVVGFNSGFTPNTTSSLGHKIKNCFASGCISQGINAASFGLVESSKAIFCYNSGINGLRGPFTIKDCVVKGVYNTSDEGFGVGISDFCVLKNILIDNARFGLRTCGSLVTTTPVSVVDCSLFNITQRNIGLANIRMGHGSRVYAKNSVLSIRSTHNITTQGEDAISVSINNDGVEGGHLIRSSHGIITSESIIRANPSGISWRLSPLNESLNELYPLSLPIATVAVNAGDIVTVTAAFYRSSLNIRTRLFCGSHQLNGIDEDIYDEAEGPIEVWERLSIEVTPTETGVFEVEAQCWGGTTNFIIVDDVTVTRS